MAVKLIVSEGPLAGAVQHVQRGWHSQVGDVFTAPKGVIGVVVAPKFPDLDIIRQTILDGIEKRPDDVWVIREKPQANHAVTVVWETLSEAGIEPFLVPLVDAWLAKREEHGYDLRRKWADAELGSTCDRIIVFHDKTSQVTASWADKDAPRIARVFVIERGKKKPVKRRAGRKHE